MCVCAYAVLFFRFDSETLYKNGSCRFQTCLKSFLVEVPSLTIWAKALSRFSQFHIMPINGGEGA